MIQADGDRVNRAAERHEHRQEKALDEAEAGAAAKRGVQPVQEELAGRAADRADRRKLDDLEPLGQQTGRR